MAVLLGPQRSDGRGPPAAKHELGNGSEVLPGGSHGAAWLPGRLDRSHKDVFWRY